MDTFVPYSDRFLGSRDELREKQLREQEQRLLERLQKAEDQQRELVEEAGTPPTEVMRGSQ